MPRLASIALLTALLGVALAQPARAWVLAGSGDAIYTASADGGLLLYCPGGDAGPEFDVGPYGLVPGAPYALVVEVEGRDALELTAPVGPATAVNVAGDDAAALVAFLLDAPTATVTMGLATLPTPRFTFTVPTAGLALALAELPCAPPAGGSAG